MQSVRNRDGESVVSWYEDGVWLAFQSAPDIGAKVLLILAWLGILSGGKAYINGANEVLVTRHDVSKANTEYDGEEPSTKESFPSFLGWNLDQRRAAECDTTKVGKNVIRDDHSNRQEEPDHALKDVVDDKVSLAYNEKQSHVGPSKLCKLEFVVTLLQWAHEEDEA
jgi:hypothetical protein